MTEKILFRNMGIPNSWEIDVYEARGGYEGLKKTLREHSPAEVIEIVKASGLRGRGGAGFPAGMKWSFVPKDPGLQRYLACNCDESEPGTFKDRQLVENDPHQLIEGIVIACYAFDASKAFVYIRGELAFAARRLERAIAQAYERGYLGRDILGSGFSLDLVLSRGAGAYICGEETALLESLEGNRPMPRSRPPFPAVVGLYGKPTVINNVETLSNVPHILNNGAEWYASIGIPPRNTGTKIYCLSGRVNRPGNYELPLGTTARELIYEHGGGLIGDRALKAFIPGGTSAPMFGVDKLDVKLDFDSVAQAGSMLGSGAVIVMDETVCIPHAVARMVEFYEHESCGKCTPCREGVRWMSGILHRIVHGQGREGDLDLLLDICDNIAGGKTLCGLGDAATNPVRSGIGLFREEFEHHIRHGRCMVEDKALSAES
ncbi:MAG: NADH-quinone oxidoreductase subunit NuoF [Sphingomonadaceae bacterium]